MINGQPHEPFIYEQHAFQFAMPASPVTASRLSLTDDVFNKCNGQTTIRKKAKIRAEFPHGFAERNRSTLAS